MGVCHRGRADRGRLARGDSPSVAVDHYHRMPDDVALMRELGLDSYRFSVSWARVKPGDREPNRAGLAFYSRLVDELLEAGILPWLTLYHWDLPQALEEKGGWANRSSRGPAPPAPRARARHARAA